jgi:hypothetical protein
MFVPALTGCFESPAEGLTGLRGAGLLSLAFDCRLTELQIPRLPRISC